MLKSIVLFSGVKWLSLAQVFNWRKRKLKCRYSLLQIFARGKEESHLTACLFARGGEKTKVQIGFIRCVNIQLFGGDEFVFASSSNESIFSSPTDAAFRRTPFKIFVQGVSASCRQSSMVIG